MPVGDLSRVAGIAEVVGRQNPVRKSCRSFRPRMRLVHVSALAAHEVPPEYRDRREEWDLATLTTYAELATLRRSHPAVRSW